MGQRPTRMPGVAAVALTAVILAAGAALAWWPDRDGQTGADLRDQSPTSSTSAGPADESPAAAPSSSVTCQLTLPGDPVATTNLAQLQAEYDAVAGSGRTVLHVDRTCVDLSTGQIVSAETIAWTPADGDLATPTRVETGRSG